MPRNLGAVLRISKEKHIVHIFENLSLTVQTIPAILNSGGEPRLRFDSSKSHHDGVSTWILPFKLGVWDPVNFFHSLGSISCTNDFSKCFYYLRD